MAWWHGHTSLHQSHIGSLSRAIWTRHSSPNLRLLPVARRLPRRSAAPGSPASACAPTSHAAAPPPHVELPPLPPLLARAPLLPPPSCHHQRIRSPCLPRWAARPCFPCRHITPTRCQGLFHADLLYQGRRRLRGTGTDPAQDLRPECSNLSTTTPLVINRVTTWLNSPRRLIHASATKNTSKNSKEHISIEVTLQMND